MQGGFGFALTVALLPQLVLAGTALVCAGLAVARPRERPDLYRWLACIGLLGAVAACGIDLVAMRLSRTGVGLVAWNGGLVVDRFSVFITVTACVVALITCLVSDTFLRRTPSRAGGFFGLVLAATLGVSAVASEHDMLTLVMAMPLVLLTLVGIAAITKTDRVSAAVAWSLLIEGTVAAALIIYGLALLYGITGSSDLATVAGTLSRAPAVAALGIALVVLGMTFFVGIVPMRQWVDTVARRLPAVPAAFVLTMATTAGTVALLRVGVSGLGAAVHPWTGLISVLVAIAVVHAGVSALRQPRVSGLLAAACSAQAALLVLAILAFGPGAGGATLAQGPTAFLFALVVFDVATVATFAILAMLQTAGLGDSMAALRGLADRSPIAAALLACALATLVGIPPLAGSVARLFIVESAVDAGYGWVALVALASMVLVAVPVVRLIAGMYAEQGDGVPFTLGATPRLGRMVAMWCCLAAVFMTVLAEPLLMLARGGAGPIP